MDLRENGGMSTFLPDGEEYNAVYCEVCQCFVKELCWLHATTVHNAPTVPLAIDSLPDVLYFAHNIQRGNSVYAKRALRPHTIFGPLIAHGHTSYSAPKLDNDFCCNWMKFVSVVGQWEEPKLRLLLRDDHLVFVTVKVILPGEELKLAVEPRYMPRLDLHSAKTMRLADVHLQIPQGCLRPAETDSGQQDNYTAYDVQTRVGDNHKDTADESASDNVQTSLLMKTDAFPPQVKQEMPVDREGSPEYPFPAFLVPRIAANMNAPKEENDIENVRTDSSTSQRCDSPIGRYPFRSRAAVDTRGNGSHPHGEEVLPVDPLLEESGGMIDDSDVDADYRLSASDESSTDSERCSRAEALPPAKKSKPSLSSNVRTHTNGTLPVSWTSDATAPDVSSPDHALTTLNLTLSEAECTKTKRRCHTGSGSGYPSDLYRFVCTECSLHFLDERLLQWHRQLRHSISADTPWKSGIKYTACRNSYIKREKMAAHVEQHGIKPERIKQYRATNDPSIMRHVTAPSDTAPEGVTMDHEPHTLCFMHFSTQCRNYGCSLRFCSEELAAVHETQHVSWKTYQGELQCPGCGFTAQNGAQLVEHVTQHGADREDRKMCRLCGELKGDMQMHMENQHKAEYDQFVGSCLEKCSQCGKRFQNLKAHITLSHTAKRVQCFICAKQFSSTNALKKHCEEHRTDKGFACPTCQKVFPKYCSFSRHTKKHDVLRMRVCQMCQAVLPSASTLAAHMIQHESDYKYRCQPCGKSFKRKGNLVQHNRCVHGESLKQRRKERKEAMAAEGYVCPRRRMNYEDFPHKCEACRLGWLRLGGLEQHKMRKHGGVDRTHS